MVPSLLSVILTIFLPILKMPKRDWPIYGERALVLLLDGLRPAPVPEGPPA